MWKEWDYFILPLPAWSLSASQGRCEERTNTAKSKLQLLSGIIFTASSGGWWQKKRRKKKRLQRNSNLNFLFYKSLLYTAKFRRKGLNKHAYFRYTTMRPIRCILQFLSLPFITVCLHSGKNPKHEKTRHSTNVTLLFGGIYADIPLTVSTSISWEFTVELLQDLKHYAREAARHLIYQHPLELGREESPTSSSVRLNKLTSETSRVRRNTYLSENLNDTWSRVWKLFTCNFDSFKISSNTAFFSLLIQFFLLWFTSSFPTYFVFVMWENEEGNLLKDTLTDLKNRSAVAHWKPCSSRPLLHLQTVVVDMWRQSSFH